MTDINKYKSVAIKIDSYTKIKTIAEEKYMSVGSFVKYLVDKEFNNYNQIKITEKKSIFKFGGF